jgi:TPR repeat protein
MVFLAMGAGWYLFSMSSSIIEIPPVSVTPVPTPVGLMDQREVARKIIEAQPDPGQAYEQAQRLYRERRYDAAFLVYRYAAQRGEGRASLAIGRMYDPSTFNAATSPFTKPNPDEAALWYAQAKRQIDPDTPEYIEAIEALQVLK